MNAPAPQSSRPSFEQSLFLALASQRMTSLLVIAFAALVAVAAFVPQGNEALELAREPGALTIHRLAAWGLTDLFSSPWMYALAVLLAANLLASAMSTLLRGKSEAMLRVPKDAPHADELSAAEPEHAALALRELFRSGFGTPVSEGSDGSRVTMVFDTAPTGRLAPISVHLGLIVLVLGAALVGRPVDPERALPRAKLYVRDTSTNKEGFFDMVAGESYQFFTWPARYTLNAYFPSYEGLGPAIRMERVEDRGRREDFWIFQRAPEGFDQRHRKGEVAIRAAWMGLVAPPGQGMASQPGAILLVLGIGALAFGALAGRRPEGRVWLEADGDRVRIIGVPRSAEDASFARMFARWRLLAASALTES